MSLGFNTESKSSGDIVPIIKFDAKAGEFIKVDKEQAADGTWVADQSEIDLPFKACLLYTSPSPRDKRQSRMPSSA